MIAADLAVVGISELATPEGNTVRTGPDLGRLRVIRDAAVACREGCFVFVGTMVGQNRMPSESAAETIIIRRSG